MKNVSNLVNLYIYIQMKKIINVLIIAPQILLKKIIIMYVQRQQIHVLHMKVKLQVLKFVILLVIVSQDIIYMIQEVIYALMQSVISIQMIILLRNALAPEQIAIMKIINILKTKIAYLYVIIISMVMPQQIHQFNVLIIKMIVEIMVTFFIRQILKNATNPLVHLVYIKMKMMKIAIQSKIIMETLVQLVIQIFQKYQKTNVNKIVMQMNVIILIMKMNAN